MFALKGILKVFHIEIFFVTLALVELAMNSKCTSREAYSNNTY